MGALQRAMADRNDIEMAPSREREKHAKGKKIWPVQDTDYKPLDWRKIFLTPKYIPWHIFGVALVVLTVLVTVYHDRTVDHLRPFSEKVRDLAAGWLIPIAVLVIISFPPLFGHEIVAILTGAVYGLWIGFAIVAAGTFIGEIATWFAFKYALRRKAARLERTNLNYGALNRLSREGGFWIVLVIRFSAIPSHFSTAVFSTADINFWYFAIATFLTLPKQIFLVYLGVLLLEEKPGRSAKNTVFAVAFSVTIIMAVYIYYRMRGIKRVLLAEQEQRAARVVDGVVEQDRPQHVGHLPADHAAALGTPKPDSRDGAPLLAGPLPLGQSPTSEYDMAPPAAYAQAGTRPLESGRHSRGEGSVDEHKPQQTTSWL